MLELVRALSPTPAVGGHPRAAALALIADVEGVERGRYAGAVGWVDAAGNGTWAVTLRCAELSADRTSACLTAGGGIVADSDPLAELAETVREVAAVPGLRVVEESRRSFDVPRTWLDVGRAREVLGWSPATSLREGIGAAWAAEQGRR